MPHFERVYTMTDYYDGPRGGIANYNGQPHIYEYIFSDEGDSYTDIFRLSPVPQDLFTLALEDWQIWLRWEAAFQNGQTSIDTHPALPKDRHRHDELEAILKDRLVIDTSNCLTAHGEFRVRDAPERSCRGFRALEVKWSQTSDPMPQ
jgi:hypothetical protein